MAKEQGTVAAGDDANRAHVDDEALVLALRQHDDGAFTALVDRYQGQMVRLAAMYVPNRAIAEDVVQETWIGVLQGIGRFEGRASFRTWLFRILTNQAKRRGARESHLIPFSTLSAGLQEAEPAVEPDRFLPTGHEWAGHWASYPRDWQQTPEDHFFSEETRAFLRQAIASLPAAQRIVITMRDVEGWPSADVCNALAISETNQRVLLHRARSKVRRALETYLERA